MSLKCFLVLLKTINAVVIAVMTKQIKKLITDEIIRVTNEFESWLKRNAEITMGRRMSDINQAIKDKKLDRITK